MSMRRRAGANVPPSSTSSSNANATDASVQPDRSSSTRRLTENCFPIVLVTSLVWLFILFVTLFLFSQFGTNASCPRPSLLQRSLCGIGHVFVSFCSDSDAPIFVHAGSAAQQSSTDRRSTTTKNNNENVPRIKFTDTYLEETCSNKESCSKDKSLYQIPDLGSLKNVNPTNWPGEMGEPYLPPSHLQDESKKRFAENMFDIVVSDQIALNRAMPDIRNDHCKAHSKFYHHLPNTSIIIVFHNEGNSTLLRTLVSIINRTPWRLIHEIILLDDASVDREYLRGPLEEFIQTLPVKTMMLRNERRLGLISSRVKAAKLATGETLMFLDSHVEVLNGWLLYLLEEIQKDRKTIVCPIIDVLTYDAFQLLHGATDIFGTFSWKMIFRWSKIQGQGIENQAAPIRTPTMAGGLYAIDRLYFEELGMYDEGIKIWGGENLEMSFKCWMCGGRIIIHPCSHVAHVFRKETPYKFLESESIFVTIFKNYKRVALVWLDEYKQLIYAVNPDIKRLNGGDVSDRLELRRKLNCSSFKHYVQMFQLKNFPLNHRFIGSVSTSKRRCLDSMTGPDISKGLNTAVQAQDCHKDGGNQIFLYTTANKIHFDEMCLEVGTTKIEGNRNIIFVMCEPDKTQQNWIYDQQNYQLKSEHFPGQCLTVQGDTNVVLAACDTSNVNQQWTFNQEVQLFD